MTVFSECAANLREGTHCVLMWSTKPSLAFPAWHMALRRGYYSQAVCWGLTVLVWVGIPASFALELWLP